MTSPLAPELEEGVGPLKHRRLQKSLRLITPLILMQWPAAHPAAEPAPVQGLDAYVTQAMHDAEVPGLAIAVVKNDAIVFAKGYGGRKLGDPTPVGEHTLFAIASTTKAFTAAALGMLVDEGKLRWDDPVTKFLPAFQPLLSGKSSMSSRHYRQSARACTAPNGWSERPVTVISANFGPPAAGPSNFEKCRPGACCGDPARGYRHELRMSDARMPSQIYRKVEGNTDR